MSTLVRDHVLVVVGLLFVIIGLLLPRARPHSFGVRTPWTLASDRVWIRTHQLAGTLAIAAGVVMLAAHATLPSELAHAVGVAGAVAAPVGAVVYSYLTSRRDQPQ